MKTYLVTATFRACTSVLRSVCRSIKLRHTRRFFVPTCSILLTAAVGSKPTFRAVRITFGVGAWSLNASNK